MSQLVGLRVQFTVAEGCSFKLYRHAVRRSPRLLLNPGMNVFSAPILAPGSVPDFGDLGTLRWAQHLQIGRRRLWVLTHCRQQACPMVEKAFCLFIIYFLSVILNLQSYLITREAQRHERIVGGLVNPQTRYANCVF